MTDATYNVMKPDNGVPTKAVTKGVPLEDAARQQLLNVAQLPFIYKWVAAMPDVHWGIGATVGTVIPTRGAIVPAAVGVDIGCGMLAVKTDLAAGDLPESLQKVRSQMERDAPVDFNYHKEALDPHGSLGARFTDLGRRFPGLRILDRLG